MGWQVARSASKLRLWRSETYGVVLTEGEVSVHPHKGHRALICITYKSQKQGGTISQGEGSPLSQDTSEQETDSREASHLKGGWGRSHCLFVGLTLSGYFKRCPGEK